VIYIYFFFYYIIVPITLALIITYLYVKLINWMGNKLKLKFIKDASNQRRNARKDENNEVQSTHSINKIRK